LRDGVFTPFTVGGLYLIIMVLTLRRQLTSMAQAARGGAVKPGDVMKQNTSGLLPRYVVALRQHLQPGTRAESSRSALRLGREAVAFGLETLELARIHEQALLTLKLAQNGNGLVKRAEWFFTEALTPLVETHSIVRQNKLDLNRLNLMLSRRTAELAASNQQLQRGLARRKAVEAALKIRGEHYAKLLKESLKLQKSLRQLTHQVLANQEDERKKISRKLQDEIAQTLLGINVRLLTLKKEARTNTKEMKNEIASTQRIVVRSVRSVRRVARKLGAS
jgi:signal transduction histidine kinase